MLRENYPLYIANTARAAAESLPVTDKWSGNVVSHVALAGASEIEEAIAAASAAATPMRKMPAYARQRVLDHCVARFRARADELAEALTIEAGKPIRDSRGEVTRLIDTFRIASEECTRIGGEVLDMEISPRARGYRGMVKRVPIGPVSLITPFNFPLNLVAHKVAPAIAAGCPFVLKPAPRTPIGALLIAEILAETDLPKGAFSVLTCRNEDAGPFITDERFKLLSFTGSRIGWDLKAKAGKKKVTLELGGNAACIVDADANLDDVVSRIIIGAFYQSGQSCISVQRILVHDAVLGELRTRLIAATEALVHGDPSSETTFVGPMIDEGEARRVERWVDEAIGAGGKLLCGGRREGAVYRATLLEDVPHACRAWSDEVFAPVACIEGFTEFKDAMRIVNDSAFGLQVGVFTRDLYKALDAWDELDVGGVVVGDVPSWRVDHMPYGGVKDSGVGREGVRYAIEDMTEPRLLVIRTP